MTISPSVPGGAGSPTPSTTRTSYPGTGTVAEPGFVGRGSRPIRFAAIGQPVSVCHQWSMTEPGEGAARRVFPPDRPESGRRGEQRLDAVFGDDPPERAGVRRADRLALVQDRRTAGDERRVHDVRVPDDPSDVGGRPVDLAGPGVVDVLHAPAQRDGVPAVVAHHALGPGRGARRV